MYTDAVPAEGLKRPISCYERFTPSKGNTLFNFSKPTSNISRFDESSPIFRRYVAKLTDILYEADIQQYQTPNLDCILAFIKSHKIVDDQKLGVNSFTAISDGGIALDVKYKSKYIHVQFDNEGDATIYLDEEGKTPEGWDLTFEQSHKKLKELLA